MSIDSIPHTDPSTANEVTGMWILTQALKRVGIDTMYGLVGIPVTEFAYIAQGEGIKFVGFRHEQQAVWLPPLTDSSPRLRVCCSQCRRLIPKRIDRYGQRHGQLLSYDSDFGLERA